MAPKPNDPITYLTYLVARMLQAGVSLPSAREAVYSSALDHPEWDMEEKKTWDEWQEKHHVSNR